MYEQKNNYQEDYEDLIKQMERRNILGGYDTLKNREYERMKVSDFSVLKY